MKDITKDKNKNLIIISIDDLRSDCIAANPHKELLSSYDIKTELKTPTLDWFVKNGTFFSNCISAASYTTASHATILTGCWQHTHRVRHFYRDKNTKPTILEILKKQGFATLFSVDFSTLLGGELGFIRGIDKYIVGNDKGSLKWLNENKGKRIAAFFHFSNVHTPYGFRNYKYDGIKYVNKVFSLAKKYNIPVNNSHEFQAYEFLKKDIPQIDKYLNMIYERIINTLHEKGKYDELMELYVEGVNYFDKNRFNKFIGNLKKLGFLENSVFVILGDHGEMWSDEMMGHSRKIEGGYHLNDQVLKVPLIFFGNGIKNNLMNDEQVRTVDIVPTILDVLNMKVVDYNMQGSSLLPLEKKKRNLEAFSQVWLGLDKNEHKSFLGVVAEKGRIPVKKFRIFLAQASIRTNTRKIVQYFNKKNEVTRTRFFNVGNGEHETFKKNSADDLLIKKLTKFNKINLANLDENGTSAKEQELLIEEMRSLGY